MARIREYELDRDLEINDKVLGTDYSGGGTMNFSVQQLGEFLASRGLADPSATDFQFEHVTHVDGSIAEASISYDNEAPAGVTTVHISSVDLKGQDTGPLVSILPTTTIEINDTQASQGTDYAFLVPSATAEIEGGYAISVELASVVEGVSLPSATATLPQTDFVNLSILGLAGQIGGRGASVTSVATVGGGVNVGERTEIQFTTTDGAINEIITIQPGRQGEPGNDTDYSTTATVSVVPVVGTPLDLVVEDTGLFYSTATILSFVNQANTSQRFSALVTSYDPTGTALTVEPIFLTELPDAPEVGDYDIDLTGERGAIGVGIASIDIFEDTTERASNQSSITFLGDDFNVAAGTGEISLANAASHTGTVFNARVASSVGFTFTTGSESSTVLSLVNNGNPDDFSQFTSDITSVTAPTGFTYVLATDTLTIADTVPAGSYTVHVSATSTHTSDNTMAPHTYSVVFTVQSTNGNYFFGSQPTAPTAFVPNTSLTDGGEAITIGGTIQFDNAAQQFVVWNVPTSFITTENPVWFGINQVEPDDFPDLGSGYTTLYFLQTYRNLLLTAL